MKTKLVGACGCRVLGLAVMLLAGGLVWAQNAGAPNRSERSPMSNDGSLVIHMKDGSVFSGTLGVSHITVDTTFGKLTVPIDKILRFTPGLESRPEYKTKILGLIEKLGSVEVLERDAAQRDLVNIGLSVRELLGSFLDDCDPERKLRVEAIVCELDEMQEEGEIGPDSEADSIRHRDTVVTTEFTIIGTIQPKTFTINNRYGRLVVKLADLERGACKSAQQSKTVRRTVTVAGSNLVPRQFKSSGIRLKRGQQVRIRAEGTIVLKPWGNNVMSTPDGAPERGWHVQNQIPNGALVARVGNDNVFMVGSKHRFTAKRSGMLEFGIGTITGQTHQNFPGEYEVKVVVTD